MGAISSIFAPSHHHHHPIYIAQAGDMGNISIRNLSTTPLELNSAERVVPTPSSSRSPSSTGDSSPSPPHPSSPPPPPTKQTLTDFIIHPFSESSAPIPAPDHSSSERLRLTFSEPGTSPPTSYTAEIPGPTPQSVVMSSPTKEFTLVYLPRARYLTILSSAHLSRWMAELPSSLPLSALSIPGTHNSPTHYLALPSVRCQAVPVRTQLDNGVRFLDIRLSCPDTFSSPSTSDLALVHSAFPIALSGTKYFSPLLDQVYTFLESNPSETVLMSLKREGTGRGTDQLLSKILSDHYLLPNASKWFLSNRIPSLGEARGKIILIRRFHLDDSLSELGIDGSVWPDNCADGTCGSGQIRIQDFYEVSQADQIQKKIELARALLERAGRQGLCHLAHHDAHQQQQRQQDQKLPPIFINFLSASNFFNASCWPDRIAAKINPSMIEYLCTGHGAPGKGPDQLPIGTGVVVIDWVGNNGDWDLVRCIVGWNARLQLQQ
ncbi:PLC-like phosphodiesterase [Echria macrotheca]|uniref:PLC-like phosphodiesterase n=1 Tax=Echria macrotheca TaxID=438768 RepID=A0AAJ0BC95_9PEZI|nr:PLC-like phosphodiesterase [Echria macrotheca]